MKKLLVVLLLALFTVGITSCVEDTGETDPVIPEVQLDDQVGEDEEDEEGTSGPITG